MADTPFLHRAGRRLLLVAAVAVLVCGVVLAVLGYQERRPPAAATAAPKVVSTHAPATTPTGGPGGPNGPADPVPPAAPAVEGPILARAEPASVDIQEIGLHAPVTSVGLGADGAVEVPPPDPERHAGWYNQGPTPGELGPAVVVGHLDSASGPAVFYDVGTLHPGSTVEIRRADRSIAVFTVDSVERFAKAEFPTQRVYGDLNRAELRLITCGGDYDPDNGGYQDNTVLFAHLTGSR
ncbi:class F sortase [Embleya sp. NPDC050154]|uniref:class F sortase n=1 Tax=Embleya sp. NPDC050154 TaxID=3363988 RepID=UPI00378F9B56